MGSPWERLGCRLLGWLESYRGLLAGALITLAVAGLASVIALGASSHSHRRRSQATGSVATLRPDRLPPASGTPSAESPGCPTEARDLAAAARVARTVVAEMMAHTLGRLGPHPSFPDATPSFQRAIWGMPHSPPPWQARASATVSVEHANLTAPGVVVVHLMVRIERPGLTPFPMLVAVSLWGCRWMASGF